MSEAAIFAFGSVVFVITTWATIVYGLATVHSLRVRDVEQSPIVDEIRTESAFTERYVTAPPRPAPSATRAAMSDG